MERGGVRVTLVSMMLEDNLSNKKGIQCCPNAGVAVKQSRNPSTNSSLDIPNGSFGLGLNVTGK